MNCQNYQTQITAARDETEFSPEITHHLKSCKVCRQNFAKQTKLREILNDLPRITAPNDFNFRLKARLRERETSAPKFALRRPLLWLAPVCAAVLIGVFAAPYFFQNTPNNDFAVKTPSVIADQPLIVEEKPVEKAIDILPQNALVNSAPLKDATAKSQPPKVIRRETIKNRNLTIEPKREKLRSVDVGLTPVNNSIMPRGIPDLLNQANKNAENIMRFFGVEARLENQILRVVSIDSNNRAAGLQKDDIIEKINDESPATMKNQSPTNINLTVRRKNQTIKLLINNK